MGITFAKNSPENEPVDEELLLKQVTALVIDQKLLAGKAGLDDRVVQFLQPSELKVSLMLCVDGTLYSYCFSFCALD